MPAVRTPTGLSWSRVPYRHAWARWVQVAFYGFISSLLFGALFATVEGGVALLVVQRVACSLGFAALLVVTFRLATMAIVTSADGVLFRNVFRNEYASWSEIVVFESPAPYGTWRKAGLRARLMDGSVMTASAVALGALEGAEGAQQVTDHLNALLDAHR